MGRPKVDEQKTQFTVMLKPSTVKKIDQLAKKINIKSRSFMMCHLLEIGMNDLKFLQKAGILYPVCLSEKFVKKLKEEIALGNIRLNNNELIIRK